MTLRRRFALSVVLVAVPLAAGLLWLRADLRRRSLVQSLREFALITMQSGGRQDCERDPSVFPAGDRGRGPPPHRPDPPPPRRGERGEGGEGGERHDPPPPRRAGPPGRPPAPAPQPLDRPAEFWAYHPDFHSSNPNAPAFPPDLRAALERGDRTAYESIDRNGREGIRIATRMPWAEGPCAILIVDGNAPEDGEADLVTLWGVIALCLAVLGAVLLAVGPIVRRIRRLQGDVRRAAAAHYAADIEVRGSDEVADLATAFNEAGATIRAHLADVEEREATLRAFVANTTHDVMIPLTVLQGHLSEQRKRRQRGEPADPEALAASLEESHYIGALLHNLGAVAKLEAGAGELTREPVDLKALVERVVERHRPLATARGIQLEYSVPDGAVVAAGDVTLLEQAVRNVVHNAIRYNDDDGHVSIVLETEDGAFRLRVLDDGPGVPEAVLERLTERRFRSLAARTRDPNGSGLGLHIARDVAYRHGFELGLRRLDPHGLEVEIAGPCVAAADSV